MARDPSTIKTRWRKIRKLAVLTVAGLGFMGVSLPVWFPWILKPALAPLNFRYESYERIGWTGFLLRRAHFENGSVQFQAAALTARLPTAWLWGLGFESSIQDSYASADGWALRFLASSNQTVTASPAHPEEVRAKISEAIASVQAWLPKAVFSQGQLVFGETAVRIPELHWERERLTASLSSDQHGPMDLAAFLPRDQPYEIEAAAPSLSLKASLQLSLANSRPEVKGHLVWLANRVDLAAEWPRDRWWPAAASINAPAWTIPGTRLGWEECDNLEGKTWARWLDDRFTIESEVQAIPANSDKARWPKLQAHFTAEGDTNSVTLTRAALETAHSRVELSAPVAAGWNGQGKSGALKIETDLQDLPWAGLAGLIAGQALLHDSNEDDAAVIAFDFRGSDLDVPAVSLENLHLAGRFEWPFLEVTAFEASVPGSLSVRAKALLNLERLDLASGEVSLKGPIPADFSPAGFGCEFVSAEASLHGPLGRIEHAGQIQLANLQLPGAAPLNLAMKWDAAGTDVDHWQAEVSSKQSVLQSAGAAALALGQGEVRFTRFRLNQDGQTLFRLAQPAAVHWAQREAADHDGALWSSSLESFHWQGPDSEVALHGAVQWPRSLEAALSIRGFNTAWIQDFIAQPLPDVEVERFDFSGSADEGPLSWTSQGKARLRGVVGGPYYAELQAEGDEAGLTLGPVKISDEHGPIVSWEGSIPMIAVPFAGSYLSWSGGEIEVRGQTHANAPFYRTLAGLTGLELDDPSIQMQWGGPMSDWQSHAEIAVKSISYRLPATGKAIPVGQDLRAALEMNSSRLRVAEFSMAMEDSPVSLAAEVPLGVEAGEGSGFFAWEKARGQLRVEDLALSNLALMFPKVLSPQGNLDVNLEWLPENQWNGELTLAGAATRPLLPLGSFYDLQGHVRVTNRLVEIRHFEGTLGGEVVTVQGQIDLSQMNQTNGLPVFSLHVQGGNVPLVRQPGLMFRTDLDLVAANASNAPPIISGSLHLRESLFLSDVKSLLPGAAAKPASRPPYFSVEAEPLAGWQLNLAVEGKEFLKVQSPLFRGQLSASLRLTETLREPIAAGEVIVASGHVRFPFASLRLTQGLITLASDNPYEPQLFVQAASRVFGYDVQMEMRGPASEPFLTFSSTPPLSSEQILLMLTAGELPKQETVFSNQQKAARFGFFLGNNLLSSLIGGDSGADRLTIRSGENISETGRQTYAVEYQLNEDWSIIGEYDRYNEFNAGLKWRFFSR